jgi:hypothetical protein
VSFVKDISSAVALVDDLLLHYFLGGYYNELSHSLILDRVFSSLESSSETAYLASRLAAFGYKSSFISSERIPAHL